MIRINTRRIVNKDGIRARLILAIDGVKKCNDLPTQYMEDHPYVELADCCSAVTVAVTVYGVIGADGLSRSMDLYVGKEYEEEFFMSVTKAIHQSCHRLSAINKEIRELEKIWSGEELLIF